MLLSAVPQAQVQVQVQVQVYFQSNLADAAYARLSDARLAHQRDGSSVAERLAQFVDEYGLRGRQPQLGLSDFLREGRFFEAEVPEPRGRHDYAWRGVFRFGFDLTERKGQLVAHHYLDGGKLLELDVSWT